MKKFMYEIHKTIPKIISELPEKGKIWNYHFRITRKRQNLEFRGKMFILC